MKRILTLVILAGISFVAVGCSTPAYSGKERMAQIGRNWSYEAAQIQDDIDHALLLRPGTRLSLWNLR
jgi:hypothetical protein